MAARSRTRAFRPICRPSSLARPHAGAHPLDDQAALQLSDGADDDHDRPTQRAGGVDLFAEADELDVQPVQLVQHLEEVLRRPGDTVTGPDQDDIELAAAGVTHHGIESRPASFRSADPVLVLFHDLIAPLPAISCRSYIWVSGCWSRVETRQI